MRCVSCEVTLSKLYRHETTPEIHVHWTRLLCDDVKLDVCESIQEVVERAFVGVPMPCAGF